MSQTDNITLQNSHEAEIEREILCGLKTNSIYSHQEEEVKTKQQTRLRNDMEA